MDKQFLNDILSKRNEMNIKKVNPKNTIKFDPKNSEYLSIGSDDFNTIEQICRQNNNIENNTEFIIDNNKHSLDKLLQLTQLLNNNGINISKNTKGLVYLGSFIFLTQIIITGINDYLMLRFFNSSS
jgi:hypothetical protein